MNQFNLPPKSSVSKYTVSSGCAPDIMNCERRLLLLSNSTLHGSGWYEWAADYTKEFLSKSKVSQVLFVPYAIRQQDEYTNQARERFESWGYKLNSVHEAPNPIEAVNHAEAIFIGGGNTFQLLKGLYDKKLIDPIRKRVLEDGVPYIGSSAGTNVATPSICTTNDMPIVYPPSFEALGLVPFNINPHYQDADPNSQHKGETREQRINQYHEIPGMPLVLGLREGTLLEVEGEKATLKGHFRACLFEAGKPPVEYDVDSDFSFILKA